MRIIFLTTFLIFVFGSCYSKPMTSEDFVYTKVYICGPKKWSIFYIPHIELIYYHFIHFDQFGNVVILCQGADLEESYMNINLITDALKGEITE